MSILLCTFFVAHGDVVVSTRGSESHPRVALGVVATAEYSPFGFTGTPNEPMTKPARRSFAKFYGSHLS